MQTSYCVSVGIDRPWKNDIHQSKYFTVIVPAAAGEEKPVEFKERIDSNKPYFKLSLDKDVFSGGDRIEGSIEIHNRQGTKIRKAVLSLIREEYAEAEGYEETVDEEYDKFVVGMDGSRSYLTRHFSLTVPRNPTPAYEGKYSSSTWYLEGKLDLPLKKDVVRYRRIVVIGIDAQKSR